MLLSVCRAWRYKSDIWRKRSGRGEDAPAATGMATPPSQMAAAAPPAQAEPARQKRRTVSPPKREEPAPLAAAVASAGYGLVPVVAPPRPMPSTPWHDLVR